MPSVHEDQHIITEILQGRETALRHIYPIYADAFRAWARRFFISDEAELTDAYQEALIVFYRNVMTGRLTTLTSSLKTYLFVIGYRILKGTVVRKRSVQLVADMPERDMPSDTNFLQQLIEEEDYQQQRWRLSQAIGKLGDVCQRILELYFYQNYSIPQIKEKLNYQSENSVSVQKSRCLKSLRDVLEQ